MQVINIVKGLTLTLEDGSKLEIAAGVQEVDDAIAGHWYVQAHTGLMPEALAKTATGDKGKKAAAAESTGDAKTATGDSTGDNAGDTPPQ